MSVLMMTMVEGRVRMPTIAYAVQSPASALAPILFNRAAMGESDVSIDILYCGVCHTDLHAARGDWPDVRYPLVPGHEIVGRVNAVGRSVSRFKVGDIVGVGFMIGSCKRCPLPRRRRAILRTGLH